MSKKRRIVLSETRGLSMVKDLHDWLAQLPPYSMLLDVRSFDGDTTVQWEEFR